MNKLILFTALFCISSIGCAAPALQPQTNLALGKKVLFSPAPNYSGTAKGDSDDTDLTDGKISSREDERLWYETSSVGWSYPGRFNLAVDLGQQSDISEISMRFQNGGTVGTGIMFPGWVEAFVSDDGKHYAKVAEFSRWNTRQNDFHQFGIKVGQARGNTWVDTLRFKDLKTHGRYVGLRVYGSTVTVSDELTVLGSPSASNSAQSSGTPSGFSVTQPQIYFNKPYLEVATNATLPVPIGLATPDKAGSDVTLTVDLPPGFHIPYGKIGGIDITTITPKVLSDGWNQYTFAAKSARADKVFGQVYMRADGWQDGQKGELRYQFSSANWQSPVLRIPLRAVTVPAAPRLHTLMASMGWWYGARTMEIWTSELDDFRTIGLNTLNVFGKWMPADLKDPQWANLEKARQQGFFISNIDSPLHWIHADHKDAPEIYDQFADGTVGKRLCISYRGQYYQEEIQRFASMMAKVKPHFSSEDIELWSGGPKESRDCTRCQADFKASGLSTWESWQEAKGQEMVTDLITAARKAVKDAGGADFETGMYDLRPGSTYQQVFNFDSLYPALLQSSEVSTYTSLQPDDVAFIGDEVRAARAKLPRSDVMPWISPGDAGTFLGDDFQWALLECYANGSRGIWFWSSRMWDSEDLIAYNTVIRAIAPVEEVIVDGDLVGSDATIQGRGRVSGMKRDNRMMLLVADYAGETNGTISLQLTVAAKSVLRDLMSGETIGKVLLPGKQIVAIPLNGQRARLLQVAPQ